MCKSVGIALGGDVSRYDGALEGSVEAWVPGANVGSKVGDEVTCADVGARVGTGVLGRPHSALPSSDTIQITDTIPVKTQQYQQLGVLSRDSLPITNGGGLHPVTVVHHFASFIDIFPQGAKTVPQWSALAPQYYTAHMHLKP